MQNEKIKKVERIFCIVTGVIALGLIIAAFINYIFVPAACTMLALCFFGLWYINKDDTDKKTMAFMFFIAGIVLVVFAVIYTIIKTR